MASVEEEHLHSNTFFRLEIVLKLFMGSSALKQGDIQGSERTSFTAPTNGKVGSDANLDVEKTVLCADGVGRERDDTPGADEEALEVKVTGEPELSAFKRRLLVPLLCSAQFFDIAVSASTIIAIPKVRSPLFNSLRPH